MEKISDNALKSEDLLAAATTAQAAGDSEARDHWLKVARQRGLTNNAQYWWLHAQRYLAQQSPQAMEDLNRSLAIAPSARAFAARARIYRQQKTSLQR